jgi:hypothetical protein
VLAFHFGSGARCQQGQLLTSGEFARADKADMQRRLCRLFLPSAQGSQFDKAGSNKKDVARHIAAAK